MKAKPVAIQNSRCLGIRDVLITKLCDAKTTPPSSVYVRCDWPK